MDVKKLIILVRSRRKIYDAKDPNNRNKDYIASVWRSIAEELQTTDKEAKIKWQNFRSNYVQEKRKQSTIPSDSKITWPFYTLLSYLDVILRHKKTTGNVPDIKSESIEGESQQNTEENYEFGEKDIQNVSKNFESQNTKDTSADTKKGKKNGASGQDYIDKMYLNILEKVTTRPNEEDDPDFMFLKSLLPSIKKLGPLANLEFKGDVIELLRHKLTSVSCVWLPNNTSSVQCTDSEW